MPLDFVIGVQLPSLRRVILWDASLQRCQLLDMTLAAIACGFAFALMTRCC